MVQQSHAQPPGVTLTMLTRTVLSASTLHVQREGLFNACFHVHLTSHLFRQIELPVPRFQVFG